MSVQNVSAISQVISFHTFDSDVSEKTIMARFQTSRVHQDGTIRIHDCQRVPREFNALFCATWRRYIYLFPLNIQGLGDKSEADVALADVRRDSRSAGIHFGWHNVTVDSVDYMVDVDVDKVDRFLRA